jgi:signal transduction histidine kinase
VLLVTSYAVVRASLVKDEGKTDQRVAASYGFSPDGVRAFYQFPVPPSKTGREAKNVGDVITGMQIDMREETLHTLLVGTGAALVALLGLSLLVGWLAAGRALRPVGKLTGRARQLSEEDLQQRLGLDGPNDELKELADTIDGMLDRLEKAFNAQRQFSASVSHELRTPLSVIRAEADVALADPDATERERVFAEKMRDAADRSESLLDSMLTLARSESTMSNREIVDLADLAGDTLSARTDGADRAGIEIDIDLHTAEVEADPWLLERVVVNLVDNAVKHNQPGGWVTLTVKAEGDEAVLQVANGGEVLSADQIDLILQPFQRTNRNRPGYGLGMTIVQSVVKAHEGSIEVEPRAEGGLVVTVRLPLASSTKPQHGTPATLPDTDGVEPADVVTAVAAAVAAAARGDEDRESGVLVGSATAVRSSSSTAPTSAADAS